MSKANTFRQLGHRKVEVRGVIDNGKCRNPNLGLVTKARACKVAGQEQSPGVTSYAPGSVGKCE